MVGSQSDKLLGKNSMRRKARTRGESGTCNVCSAPCSSCRHLKLGHMGLKGDECSVNEGDVLPSFENRACDSLQHTASEASNLLSVDSCHDSLSENAESKANTRSSGMVDAADESVMLPKTSGVTVAADQLSLKLQDAADQKPFPNSEHPKVVEGHDDNISCVSGANDASTILSCNKHVEMKSSLGSSSVVSSLGAEESGKALTLKSELLETPPNDDEDTFKISSEIQPKLEADSDKNTGDQLTEGLKPSNQVEQDEKSNAMFDLPDVKDPPDQSASGDESDESEIMEHDVKVCDICGDAGREDLLAICSRCSDGAEHTYCMREMLQKVPEGDWLCEECKLAEENENLKQGSDFEAKGMNKASTEVLCKRPAETMEVASSFKRQAVETSLGSPKSSSPSRIAALSRDNSSKSLDKGKVKAVHQTSFGNHSGTDNPEIARSSSIDQRLQSPKGTLLKSNSFNTLNAKPKVKLFNEVPQMHKFSRESSSHDSKEGANRMMGKSMSFKAVNSGRPNANESKVKMLSSKVSHVQETKGLKQVKERNAFERKSVFKLDHSMSNSLTSSSKVSTPKVDQKLTPRGETAMPSYNNRESKAAQSDCKLGNLSRSNSSIARKGAEMPVASVRASPVNGMSFASAEQRLNQVSPKDEISSSSSWTAEKPSNYVNENSQDSLPRSRDTSNQGERARESSTNCLRPAVAATQKNVSCQKCKEVGHAAEQCTIITARASDADVPVAKSVKEEIVKGSKLKAAIEAAILRKPGIYGKKKESDQSDGLSSSNVDISAEMASAEQFAILSKMKNTVSDEGTNNGRANSGNCFSDSDRQFNNDSSGAMSVLPKTAAIPEHEYIWQGAFEVRSWGKFLDLHSGMQAHLSTCASPKALEVVSKFPHRITLEEIPRSSTWPRQFLEIGAKEDNIALYFFAKDLDSYERYYQGLLDNMMKRDLALRGFFDGVELLIFPSNQLPDNSQRWNMLFFLWGVFRARRLNFSDSLSTPVIPSLNVVDRLMSSSDQCLPESVNKETSACNSASDVSLVPIVPDEPYISSNGDADDKMCCSKNNSDQQDSRLHSKVFSKNASTGMLSCPGVRSPSPLEEVNRPECRSDPELKSSSQAARADSGSNGQEKTKMCGDALHVKENLSSFNIFHAANRDLGFRGRVDEEHISRKDAEQDNVRVERDLNEMDMEAPLESNPMTKELHCWQSNGRKRQYLDLSETAPETSSSTIQKMPWNKVDTTSVGRGGFSKKLKTDLSGINSLIEDSMSSESFPPQLCDLGPSSLIDDKISKKASDEKVILEDLGTTERHFFPVDSQRVKDFCLGDNIMSWKEYSLNDGDLFSDVTPNLELALGAESKSSNKEILPFFVGMVEKNHKNKPPDKVTDKEEEDDVSASLSLSLSFPFPDKEQNVKPVPKTEPHLPERRHVNTSLLLFGGFSDK